MKSKKAQLQVGFTPADFYIMLTWAGIILVFIVLFQIQGCQAEYKREIESASSEITSNTRLLNYLRTPITVEGKEMNLADLIVLWHADKAKYQAILEKEGKAIVNNGTYEFTHPITDNQRIMAFYLAIYSKKHIKGELPDIIARISSDKFISSHCIKSSSGMCKGLSGVYIPVEESKTIYIELWASQAAKSNK